MAVRNFPGDDLLTVRNRAALLGIFALPDAERQNCCAGTSTRPTKCLSRLVSAAAERRLLQGGHRHGPDLAHAAPTPDQTIPCSSATPLPDESALPGWRAAAAGLLHGDGTGRCRPDGSVARGLALPETIFDDAFENGISTLRLIRYPLRVQAPSTSAARLNTVHNGKTRTSSAASMPIPASSPCSRRTAWKDCRPGTLPANGSTFRRPTTCSRSISASCSSAGPRARQGDAPPRHRAGQAALLHSVLL